MEKTNKFSTVFQGLSILVFLTVFMVVKSCKEIEKEAPDALKTELTKNFETVIWNIKAIHPDGRLIDVKAIDKDGDIYGVKAVQSTAQRSFIDVKALVGEHQLPVKLLVSSDKYTRVKALADDGSVYDIKALTPEGDTLDVKGVSRTKNIIHIKAINKAGEFYGIKAISPEGKLNDVKGVKMTDKQTETVINGHAVYAHIKALPQAGIATNNGRWHIKAFHPEGITLDIKAFDPEGKKYDVKAIQDSYQRSLLDIKAIDGDNILPIKMIVSKDKYAPIKAISKDGILFDVKALTPDGRKLDVKGVERVGNIVHVKAINKDGDFYGVKAISPDGELNDVKGVKINKDDLETEINGQKVFAHVKAIPQVY
ncbi:MAG: hypothetical protein GY931_01610 [Maribacter sp.]|nr:hypothetical protein [Maribacter sp.]